MSCSKNIQTSYVSTSTTYRGIIDVEMPCIMLPWPSIKDGSGLHEVQEYPSRKIDRAPGMY